MAEQKGIKLTWMTPMTADTPQDVFSVTSGLDDIVFMGFNGKTYAGVPQQKVIGFFTGSSALTTSNYNGLPIGSIIIDTQAYKIHFKVAATTWKSSAAAT